MPVKVEKEECIGCGACLDICPTNALVFTDDGKVECKEADCIDCGACLGTCPVEAIKQ